MYYRWIPNKFIKISLSPEYHRKILNKLFDLDLRAFWKMLLDSTQIRRISQKKRSIRVSWPEFTPAEGADQ